MATGVLALAYLACLVAAGWGGVDAPLPIDAYLACLGGAFAAYAGLAFLIVRRPPSRRLGRALMAAAVAGWLILLAAPARYNSDVWRYLWDGHAVARGHNPYASAPADFAPRMLGAPAVYVKLNPAYNEIRTVYGPAAAVVFAAASRLPGNGFVIRAVMTLAALSCVALLTAWLRRLRLPEAWALLFALNPLALDSFAQRGQMDALMLAPLAASLLLSASGRPGWAGAALAVSAHTKIPALLAAPLLLAQRGAGRRFAAAFAGVLALGALPFIAAGPAAFEGYLTFASNWRVNGSLYPAMAAWLGGAGARAAAGVLLAALVLAMTWWTRRRPEALPAGLLASFLGLLLLAPAVFPWYVTWLLPLAAAAWGPVSGRVLAAAALTWSATALLWYARFLVYPPLDDAAWPGFAYALRQAAGAFAEPWRVVEYGLPAAVALAFGFGYALRAARPGRNSSGSGS